MVFAVEWIGGSFYFEDHVPFFYYMKLYLKLIERRKSDNNPK